MTATTVRSLLTTLTSKISTFDSYLSSYGTNLNEKSTQTYYGIPDAIGLDVQTAIEMVVTAYNKCLEVTAPSGGIA